MESSYPLMATQTITGNTLKSRNNNTMTFFRFFDLPRELRNLVYQLAVERKRIIFRPWRMEKSGLWATNYCLTSLLLVNKEFNQEYGMEVWRYTHVFVRGQMERALERAFEPYNLLQGVMSNSLMNMRHFSLEVWIDEEPVENRAVFSGWFVALLRRKSFH